MTYAFVTARRRVVLAVVSVAFTVLSCSGLLLAAALVPAPTVVLPFVVLAGIGTPMAAAFDLARALATHPSVQLRHELDRLPETPHPLGY